MKQNSNSSPITKIYNQDDHARELFQLPFRMDHTNQQQNYQVLNQFQPTLSNKNFSPIRQHPNPNGLKVSQNSTASILERLKEKQAQPPKIVINGLNNISNSNGNQSNSQIKIGSSNAIQPQSKVKSPNNRARQQQQYTNEGEVIAQINQSPEKIQLHEQYFKYTEEFNNGGRSSNLSQRTPTSPTKQNQKFPSQTQITPNKSGYKKAPLNNNKSSSGIGVEGQDQQQNSKHLNKSSSEMISSNVLEKIVDLEIKLKKEYLKNQQLENQVDTLSKSNDKLSRLNHDLTMQNSSLVNQITINDQQSDTPGKRSKSSNKHEFMERDSQAESSINDIYANDINYMKNLENECNKLQVLLEQKNRELQSWMQRYVEMQKKKEVRFEESETFSIMKKQLEKSEEAYKKQGEQLRLLEAQKASTDKLTENLREEIVNLKGERDIWMNKYSDFIKQNNKKDQEESYEMVVLKSQKDELQLKYSQLSDQLNEQSQFLQEQKQWTEHWKNKAVQLETKIQDSSLTENNKTKQKIDELENKLHRAQLENQSIKNNQILENQIQESERFAKVNAEKQEIQNQCKNALSKLDILSVEYKNEREDKLNCLNQLENLRKEMTDLKINYEKRISDLDSMIKEKSNQVELLKRNEKEEQIKEINNRQQQEIETIKMRNKIVQLETELGNSKIELEKSQAKQKDYQRELDSWSKKCETIERQHKEQLDELNQHHIQLKQSNIDREVKSAKLETEGKIFYLDNQVKILTKEVSIWKEKYQSLELESEETIKLKNVELNENQNKLQFQNQKNLSALNEINEKYDKESKIQLEKIAEQKHQIKMLQQQVEQIQMENQSLQENSVKRIKDLQEIAQKAQQEIKVSNFSQLETKIKQLQRQLLQIEIEKNQEIEEKQQQINQLENERTHLKDKIQLYSQEIKNLVSYLEKEKQNVEETQKLNAQLQKERDDIENQINELRDQFENKSTNCDFLLTENEQLNKKITNLKIQLNHSQNQNQQKSSQEIKQTPNGQGRLLNNSQQQQQLQQQHQYSDQEDNQKRQIGNRNEHTQNNLNNNNNIDSDDEYKQY